MNSSTYSPKILIADHKRSTVDLLRKRLRAAGYQTCEAYDGEQALALVPNEKPDLILVEAILPKIDGFSVLRALRLNSETANIPVIMVTSKREVPDQVRGLDNGADDYITKPFHPQLLMARIRSRLRRSDVLANLVTAVNVPAPKVFVSYKWEDDAHNAWVMKLATDLRSAGIDAILDQWEVRYGDSFTDFMTARITEADVVLFIMTSASVASVEGGHGQGGAVKFEMQLATSRRTAGDGLRIIPVYREGNKTAAHVRDHRYADFEDDSKYEDNLQDLVDDILSINQGPPPLGSR